jgi:peptidoglycan/LPS O-acetylase OafA/YrhL
MQLNARSTRDEPGASAGRYELLDGMRGVAAAIVLFFHFRFFFPSVPIPPNGYLAVDLFFALSGFVLVNAYGAKLTQGMSAGKFFAIRFFRLYPLYILGTLVSLLFLMASLPGSASGFWPVPFALVMAPSVITPTLYPLNVPAWSLLLELLVNLALVLVWKRLSIAVAIWICALSALWLVFSAYHFGSLDFGHQWEALSIGLARVTYSFFLGAALRLSGIKLTRLHPVVILVALVVIFVMPIPTEWRILADLLIVLFIFPTLLLAAASVSVGPSLRRFCSIGGAFSYPLYATHGPLLVWFYAISQKFKIPVTTLFIAVVTLAIFAFAYLAEVFFDKPIRAMIKNRFSRT